MNKKFEYIDDNPGSYFGMLVESLNESNDYSSEVKDYNIYAIKKDGSRTLVKTIHGTKRDVESEINGKYSYLPKLSFVKKIEVRDADTDEKVFDESLKENKSTKSKKLVEDLHTEKQIKLLQSRLSDFRKSWINLCDTLEYVDYEVASSIDDDYPFDVSFDELSFDVMDWLEDCIARCDWLYDEAQNGRFGNLTEDKFIPQDKMSKKAQKELNDKKRGTWGNTNPVTRVQPNKKAYDRKRDKKVVDESKQLNEVRDFEWGQELWAVVKDNGDFAGNPCLSWEEAREISANHEGSKIYEMTLDRDQINESVSKKDLYDALKDAYGMTKKEADKWIKDASEKSKEEIVKGFKSNAKKSFKYD